MKFIRNITLFALVIFTSVVHSQSNNLNKLNWLIGHWKKTDSITKKTSIENWSKLSETEFGGIGCTLKVNDTVFVEKLKIISKGNTLYYVADVKENKGLVLFKFSSITKNGFVCENPEHDFPKKIEYKLTNKHLTVIISDDKKKINFEFDRKK
ncbi:MAG: DUF6265 family protein [Bacteroidota bacterium]|nr:DUF6265 family protein [Bacteroidota bacterium]